MAFDTATARANVDRFLAEERRRIHEAAERLANGQPPLKRSISPITRRRLRNRELARITAAVLADPTATPLRRLRVEAGLTVRELSDRAGIGEATLYRVERREQAPAGDTLAKIAAALGVETDDITE